MYLYNVLNDALSTNSNKIHITLKTKTILCIQDTNSSTNSATHKHQKWRRKLPSIRIVGKEIHTLD